MSAARNPPVRSLNEKIAKARFSERRERSERRGLLAIRPRACGTWALQIPQRAAYPCVRLFWKGRERNCGDWKNENGRVHHPAYSSAGGGAFRRPRLRDGYGGGSDARRARARVQPCRDCAARANPSARCAADCDIRAIRRARYARAADCDICANPSAHRRANCHNRANIRARYADTRANCDNSADRCARARYAHARADSDNRADYHIRANIRAEYANTRANNDSANRARRYADSPDLDIRARADGDLHADARANRDAGSPDADARAHVDAGSPDPHALAAARRQRQGGQRRRRARARFHAQFRGRLIAHHRESAG